MAIVRQIKILTLDCGRCHGTIASDNTGSGKAWVHLDGEPADGHYPHFGVVLDREQVIASCQRFEPEPDPDDIPLDEPGLYAWVMPPPEIEGRPATDEEIGLSNRTGRRQIVNAAAREEFTVDSRYSRGWIADQWGRPKRVADSLGIFGIHSDGRGFHAWWLAEASGDLKFENARLLGAPGFHGQRELIRYIRGEEVAPSVATH